MKRSTQLALCLLMFALLSFVVFALDELCLKYVGDGEISVIRGVLSLRHVTNTGAAFSLLSGKSVLLSVLSALILLILLGVIMLGNMRPAARFFLTAAFAGGACNLYMRLFRGGVNDWIELKFINFPLFNFADICVCAGVIIFALIYIFQKGEGTK